MSLSSLINGADCGPSNALQSLTKRVDADRGLQQDFFGAGRAGPSNAGFRTTVHSNAALNAEKAGFFNSPARPMHPQPAFDLSSMGRALDTVRDGPMRHSPSPLSQEFSSMPKTQGDVTNWAADFMMEGPATIHQLQPMNMQNRSVTPQSMVPAMMPMNHMMRPGPSMMHMYPMPAQSVIPQPVVASAQSSINWDEEFLQQTNSLETSKGKTAADPVIVDSDELSRTAGLLLESVKDEENPKFQNSAFMGFMRQIRDKEMVVDGDKIVPSSEASVTATATGTATRTVPTSYSTSDTEDSLARRRSMTMDGWPMKSVHFEPVATAEETVEGPQEESEEDAYWRVENRDYREYWEKAASLSSPATLPQPLMETMQQREWGVLQESWDAWEATTTGVRQTVAPNYPFQTNNPYVFDTRTGTSSMRSANVLEQNVLEREAAVLDDPQNADAWYNLGIKQQANEREGKAIQALQKAVELDPSMLPAWMELAVSHTNNGSKVEAYAAMSEWIQRNPKYTDVVTKWKQSQNLAVPYAVEELIDCLVTMARALPGDELDADVQVALGVLLNTTEEYDKARDCFLAALDARPSDYLLYNRVGATIANHGQAKEAIPYYHRALALNPSYIRARFNLGISCISLQKNEEAAEHILDALVLQENDNLESEGGRGITSSVLWDTLRSVCLHLHRSDLARLCERRDLNRTSSLCFESNPADGGVDFRAAFNAIKTA
ncbi:hypothetical protein M408DRAFT_330281 [Serendipita vermifera MAFF 305830]|uniref:Uncharacterized protein n=1 Tax=Serendipita vermifera MAFF 305830 TaxID=933852 RepID=A0A0C2XCP9_SERVB|nr:hypothetical protein M408DRAFT_330281 [Serendipita vermifera MAFF 305830]